MSQTVAPTDTPTSRDSESLCSQSGSNTFPVTAKDLKAKDEQLSTQSGSIMSKADIFGPNQGLHFEEPLIFEYDAWNRTGIDFEDFEPDESLLDGVTRSDLKLPGLSEPETVRHFTRLSQKNYGIDTGFYPLGSCTMKHNPRLNEKVARYFAHLHPMQPISSVQGGLEVIYTLSDWLCKMTGMAAVAMTPAAGAQGELCGIMAIHSAIEAQADEVKKSVILVPESAHGTNPATAAACGFKVRTIPTNETGRVTAEEVKQQMDEDVAGIMLTNPNTCGLFENQIVEIAEIIHDNGGYFYCDGANFNAIAGTVKPADLGVDCMHINLHKTFSTPHGGGGPGSGPVVLSERLAPFAPYPSVVKTQHGFELNEEKSSNSIGRLKGFHGQMGMFTRALAYIMSHGADGLKAMSENAVLAANYLRVRLSEVIKPSFPGMCMHEVLFDDSFLKGTGISTLDFSKGLIDAGYHPMTMYFPLVVSGAMLIEPTESESKASLDHFADTFIKLVKRAKAGDKEFFLNAPQHTPRKRLDETKAARQPKLKC